MDQVKEYIGFLEGKIVVAEDYGTDIDKNLLSDVLLPHQAAIVPWAIEGGRRAIFASFGLGKTLMQLEIAKQVIAIKILLILAGVCRHNRRPGNP